MRKEHLKVFRAAAWTSDDEVRAFAAEAGPSDTGDVARLVEMLVDRSLAAHPQRHRHRCAAFRMIAEQSLDRGLFTTFLSALAQGDDAVRAVLLPLIPQVNDLEQHQALCKLLGAQDESVRRAAGQLLGQIGGPTALAHLVEMVKQKGFAGRMEAMDVMVPKAKHRAIPLLSAVLAAGDPRERARALRYLSDPETMARGLQEAVEAMRPVLRDSYERVASEAIKAFARLVAEQTFFDELWDLIESPAAPPALFEALGGYKSPRVVDVLARRLRTGNHASRMAVLEALATIGNDRILPTLMEALSVPDPAVQRRATEILSQLSIDGKIDLARAILWLLRSGDTQVRRLAAHLAKTVGDPTGELTPKLLRFLRDEDWWVRERVMDALVEMGNPALTEHVVTYLEDPSPVIRRFGIGALLRIKDPASLGAVLRSAMHDEDWWVREQAVLAAAELGDARAVPYLKKLALEVPDLRIACLEALVALSAHDTIVELAELAADDEADVRLAVVRALEAVPDGREAFLYVRSCLEDADARVSRASRELLEKWQLTGAEGGESREALGLLDRLLVAVARAEADDLMLAAGRRPYVKHLGQVRPISKNELSEDELRAMLLPHLTSEQRAGLEGGRDVDMSYQVASHGIRFRVNVFRQMVGLSAVFRRVHENVPQIDELGLPPVVKTFADFPNGLVLVGGPTGAGKSTTLAALIDYINRTRAEHVVTIEDPIEVVHPQKQSLLNQREVGTHTRSFPRALRSTLRQDPDVILVGEMRDAETIEFALNAAETGHLVFATVHTSSADASIDRVIHVFPAAQQPQVRVMLAESLRAVLCQQLLRRVDQPGARVLAVEVLLVNDAVSNLIRKDKCFQIPSAIATGRELGMQLMDQELERLFRRGVIEAEEALMKANDKSAFASLLEADLAGEKDARPVAILRGSVAPPSRTSAPPESTSMPPVTPGLRASFTPGQILSSSPKPDRDGGGER